MSDDELEKIRKRKLAQLRKHLQEESEDEKKRRNRLNLLKKTFVGRAWEVFHATQRQYPHVARELEKILTQLISSGKIKRVTGEELYYLLRKMGLRVRLKTRIKVKEHGKLMSLQEKLKK